MIAGYSVSRYIVQKNDGTFLFFFFHRIVDDSEMYEQQKPFRLDELVRISAFLNNLVFKMLWNEMVDGKTVINRRFSDRYRQIGKKARALGEFYENCRLSSFSQMRFRPKAGAYPRLSFFLTSFFSIDRDPCLLVGRNP